MSRIARRPTGAASAAKTRSAGRRQIRSRADRVGARARAGIDRMGRFGCSGIRSSPRALTRAVGFNAREPDTEDSWIRLIRARARRDYDLLPS